VVVAASEDAVWVVNRLDGTVSRIDPASRTVTDTIAVSEGGYGAGARGVAVSDDAVWVATGDDTVVRIG
jgi:YVTN family beta-propeller protein